MTEPAQINVETIESDRQSGDVQMPGRVRRFLRRHPMVVCFGFVLTATLVMRLAWGWQIDRQVQAQYAQLSADGQWVHVSDLPNADVSDRDNAIPLIIAAGTSDSAMSPSNSPDSYPEYLPLGDRWERDAAASEARNTKTFQIARQVRQMENPQLRTPLASPLFMTLLPELNSARTVANTVSDGALYLHIKGNDREALERLRDTLHLAKLTHQQPCLVSQLVGIGITCRATERSNIIAPGLRMDDPEVRRVVKTLISELLDDKPQAEAFRRSLEGERLFVDDGVRMVSADAFTLKPLAYQEIELANRKQLLFGKASRETTAEDARAILQNIPRTNAPPPERSWLFGGGFTVKHLPDYANWYSDFRASLHRSFEQWYRCLGERRTAAISLAVQLYRADHAGRLPEKLDDLVPNYLPAVPIDPFPAEKPQIGYLLLKGSLPDGSDRPLLYYHAGPDLPGIINTEPMYSWWPDPQRRGDSLRQYRDLSRWSPATRSTDATVKQQDDEDADRLKQEKLEQQRIDQELSPQQ